MPKHTCDNCGRKLQFTGNLRVIVCCNIRYRISYPTEEERQKVAAHWNNSKTAQAYANDKEQAN